MICMISSFPPDPNPTKMKSPFSKLEISSTGSVVSPVPIVVTVLTNVVAIPLSTLGSFRAVNTVVPTACEATEVPY